MALAWITGAHGFIGRNLAAHLSANGDQVAGIGHGAWAEPEARAWGVSHWINGDVHSSNLQNLRKKVGVPDVVFHLAGGSSVGAAIAAPHEDFFRTVASTVHLLDWIRHESPATVSVVASSAAIYGAGHSGRIPESANGSPFSPYGHHKLMMEQVCRGYGAGYGLHTVIARLFSVYGAGLRKQLLWDICCKLSQAGSVLQLSGTGGELRDWTDVRDVVRALAQLKILASPESPALNVGTAKATSVREIAETILSAWPSDKRLVFSGEQRAGDPFSLVADGSGLLASGFEWRVPVETGVREYVAWYLDQSRALA